MALDSTDMRDAPTQSDGRPALEKQLDVVETLRKRGGTSSLTAAQLYEAMVADDRQPVDLREDVEVDQMLRKNTGVDVVVDNEGEAHYGIATAYDDVVDRATLFKRIGESKGVAVEDLEDCYNGASEDIESMIVSGEILATSHQTTRKVWLWPRIGTYLVQLGGQAKSSEVEEEHASVTVTADIRNEVRRGDAVKIGVAWARVSSRVSAGRQPKRAERPLSVSSVQDMHKDNNYIDVFDDSKMPVVPGLDKGGPIFKHGCTNDVKDLWFATTSKTPKDRAELAQLLKNANLDDAAATARRPTKRPRRTAEPAVTKKRKKQQRSDAHVKITNTHLRGTEIGNILAAADERRKNPTKQKE